MKTIQATALRPQEWRCVRIITVSLNVGSTTLTADVIYERAITDVYKVDTTINNEFELKQCICEKDKYDNFIYGALSQLFHIEYESQEVVMFNIERETIENMKSSYVRTMIPIRFSPVLDVRMPYANQDVFQVDLPLYVHTTQEDLFTIQLFANKVCKIPYALSDYSKISQFSLEFQLQLK